MARLRNGNWRTARFLARRMSQESAGSGRGGTEHGAVTDAYAGRPRAVAPGGSSRPPRNGCWIKGRFGRQTTCPVSRCGGAVCTDTGQTRRRETLAWRADHSFNGLDEVGLPREALFGHASLSPPSPRWWPGQQVGRSVDCRNQPDDICRERADSRSGCGYWRRWAIVSPLALVGLMAQPEGLRSGEGADAIPGIFSGRAHGLPHCSGD